MLPVSNLRPNHGSEDMGAAPWLPTVRVVSLEVTGSLAQQSTCTELTIPRVAQTGDDVA